MTRCFNRLIFLTIGWVCLMERIRGFSLNANVTQAGRRMKRDAFVCPGDGKWPDETDCGKFHNCQGTTDTGGWCGPGMSFDTENQRCEMALAINCKDGDRPDWKPPDNWQGKTKQTTTTTKKAEATSKSGVKQDSPISSVTIKSGDNLKENDKCSFKGLVADKENCQSYFYCKDSETRKESCADRQLFDEETKSCKEFKNVYCGDRPVNDKGKDQCRSRPNGVYPNIESGCSEFYQCNNQKKVKSGECPPTLKFNMLTLRCDYPSNVQVPCGTKLSQTGAASSSTVYSIFNILSLFVLSLFISSIWN